MRDKSEIIVVVAETDDELRVILPAAPIILVFYTDFTFFGSYALSFGSARSRMISSTRQ
jgi:hypothetical protein